MDLLIVSATPFEVAPLNDYLDHQFIPVGEYRYQKGELTLSLLITGVGLTLTAYALGRLFALKRYDLAINAGIAGAFDSKLELGQVVQVVSERFGDLGVEEADARFTDIHELGLIDPDQAPFTKGRLLNKDASNFEFLEKVNALTVNKVHGHTASIDRISTKYDVQIESMEGAAFFYACLQEQIPFLELRAISNYIESRDREKWKVELAVQQLNEVLSQILKLFI